MTIHRTLTNRILLLLALLITTTALPAQKRKTTKRSKAKKTTTVIKKNEAVVLPVDSLIGKVYAGKIGRTVVDFFGNRVTYGDVTQQIYIWHDSIAVIDQRGGDTQEYLFLPYTLNGSTLTIGQYRYTTIKGGTALELQKMKEGQEERQGTLTSVSPLMMTDALYYHGKHLDKMTIQTDEDKRNVLTCLNIAAENGNADAKQYLYEYYKKRADSGEMSALRYMSDHETEAGNYANAIKYCEKLIDLNPKDMQWLCKKGAICIKTGNISEAKKVYKKIKKLDKEFYADSNHPFMQRMREL